MENSHEIVVSIFTSLLEYGYSPATLQGWLNEAIDERYEQRRMDAELSHAEDEDALGEDLAKTSVPENGAYWHSYEDAEGEELDNPDPYPSIPRPVDDLTPHPFQDIARWLGLPVSS